jgi:hypothetical protein
MMDDFSQRMHDEIQLRHSNAWTISGVEASANAETKADAALHWLAVLTAEIEMLREQLAARPHGAP